MARSVSVFLRANVAPFLAGMRSAAGAVGDLERRISTSTGRQRQAFNRVGQAGTVMAVGLVGGFALATKATMDFDKQLSKVKAAAQANGAEVKKLGAIALEAGKKTAFSATEAAKGEEELVKAGVSVKDVLGGGLKGALDLASAGQLGVGEAAEVAATAMTQFNLTGKDMPHIADLIAAGAGKAQGEVHDLGFALKMSGLVAAQFGLSIEDTTGTLAAFARAGLIGSDAGTSFKTMLLHLAAPTKKAASLMQDLGINTYDSQGQFIGIVGLAGVLQQKLGGLSQEQRNAALSTIFGTDAIRSANVLYQQGAKGIQGWIERTNDAGFAARVAGTKMDNLAGDLKRLRGAIDTALINGGTAATGALRGMTEATTGAINAYSSMPSTIQGGIVAFVGLAGAALLGAKGLLFVTGTIADTRIALAALDLAAIRARFSLAAIGKGAAAALLIVGVAVAFDKAADASNGLRRANLNVKKLTASMLELGQTGKVTGELKRAFGSDLQGVTRSYAEDIRGLGKTLKEVADPSVSQAIDQWSSRTWGKFTNFPKQATDKIKALDKSLADLTSSGHSMEAQQAFQKIAEQAKASGVSVDELNRMFPEFSGAQHTAATSATKHAEAEKNLQSAMAGAAVTADELQGKLDELTKASMAADQAAINQAKAVKDAAKASDHRRKLSLEEKQALLDLAEADNKHLVAMTADGATGAQRTAKQAELTRQFIKTAIAMGQNREQATELAKRYGLIAPPALVAANATAGYIDKVKNLARAQSNLAITMGGPGASSQKAYRDQVAASLPVLYALAGRNQAARAQVDALARASGVAAGRQTTTRAAFLKTAASMNIAKDKAQDLWAAFNKIKSKTVTLSVYAQGTWAQAGSGTQHAKELVHGFSGGAVPSLGPQSSRAHDSVPAMLRVDEHVWTPEEVDAVGGHASMYRIRRAALAGKLQGYAKGGAVSMTGSASSSQVSTTVLNPVVAGMAAMVTEFGNAVAAAWKKIAGSGGPVVAAARSQIGLPYSWGGGGPGGPSYGIGRGAGTYGFDCSGLTEYAWWQGRHKAIGGVTDSQWASSTPISGPRPGALAFPSGPGVHVMLGSNKPGYVIQAPHTGAFVEEVPRTSGNWRWPTGMATGGEVRLGEKVTSGRAGSDDVLLAKVLQIAGSGPRRGEQHDAQIARSGDMRLWAEPETGGEAYIPLAAGKRNRSKAILASVARVFGMSVRGMADGGITGFADGGLPDVNLSDYMSKYTDMINPATKSDVTSAQKARRTQIDQLKNAEDALAKARKKHHKDWAQIRRDERRVAAERRDVAAATKTLADVEARYKKGQASPATQLGAALGMGIKNTGNFIKNLTSLADRGFGTLAQQLLTMGGPEAEKIAADAVKFSSKKLTTLQGQVVTAQQQQATLTNLPNILAVRSAMKGGKGGTWIGLLNATGLDPGTLATAVHLMAGDLGKTTSGKSLLADMKAHGYVAGGWIRGAPGVDRNLIGATAGEFMVRQRQASKYGPLIEAINSDRVGDALLRRYISGSQGRVRSGGGGDGSSAPVVNNTFHHQEMNPQQLSREVARETAWVLSA